VLITISRIFEFEVIRWSDYTLDQERCEITMVMPGREWDTSGFL
jgi:hypothetical protein